MCDITITTALAPMITYCGSGSATSNSKHTINREPTTATKKRKKPISGRNTHNTNKNKRVVVMATAATGRPHRRCVCESMRLFVCIASVAASACQKAKKTCGYHSCPAGCVVSQRFTRQAAALNGAPGTFMAATRPVAAALSIELDEYCLWNFYFFVRHFFLSISILMHSCVCWKREKHPSFIFRTHTHTQIHSHTF